jgi:glycosyltransferase involved in cell wall biosynthesis
MKVLLLTDAPPSKKLPGALLTDALVRFFKPGTLVCYAVVNPHVDIPVSPDLGWIPLKISPKPLEEPFRLGMPGIWGEMVAALAEFVKATVVRKTLMDQMVRFGQKHQVDTVWSVLQGQTIIGLTLPVARRLKAKLLCQVWDVPEWWIEDNQLDRWTARRMLREYDRTIRSCDGFTAASPVMAEDYAKKYGVKTTAFVASLLQRLAHPPRKGLRSKRRIVISVAGKLYAPDAWESFLQALEVARWRLAGREVVIRLIGNFAKRDFPSDHFEITGYKTQEETIRLVAEGDLAYCPYRFDRAFKPIATTSFPAKLTTYLAAGVPVFFHGPQYSSPAHFLAEHQAGYGCYTLKAREVLKCLYEVVTNERLYRELATKGSRAFQEHLTTDHLAQHLREFLNFART